MAVFRSIAGGGRGAHRLFLIQGLSLVQALALAADRGVEQQPVRQATSPELQAAESESGTKSAPLRSAGPGGVEDPSSRATPGERAVPPEPREEEPGAGTAAQEESEPDALQIPADGLLYGADRILQNDLKGRGILELRDPFPLALLHLQLPIDTLVVLPEGNGRFEVDALWANSFARKRKSSGREFVIDAETYELRFSGWYAIKSDFYVGGELALHGRGGGVLDRFVDGFHDTFGLDAGPRGGHPRDEFLIVVPDPDGTDQELKSGVGVGDLVLRTHWIAFPGNGWLPAVSLQGLVSLPTSTEGFGSDSPDFGINLSLYKGFYDRVYIYVVAGGTIITDRTTKGFLYRTWNYQLTAGAEVVVLPSLSLIVQGTNHSPLLDSSFPSPLDITRNYLAGGVKWEFVDDVELTFSLLENLDPFENSTDITFQLGFGFDF